MSAKRLPSSRLAHEAENAEAPKRDRYEIEKADLIVAARTADFGDTVNLTSSPGFITLTAPTIRRDDAS